MNDFKNAVAIVGLSGHFPGAPTVSQFWDNVIDAVDAISRPALESLRAAGVPDAILQDQRFTAASGRLDGIDLFDRSLFGMNRWDAGVLNPQIRLFLDQAHAALEDASIDPSRTDARIGVYAGAGRNDYERLVGTHLGGAADPFTLEAGNSRDFFCTRVSYALDLRGPSMTVQTACSTSLVALHQGVMSLLNFESDVALAGASSVRYPETVGYLSEAGDISSKDGACRSYDDAANGTVAGDGVGVLVLKRMEDALADRDHIHAVVLGTAANNDGRKSNFASVSKQAHVDVINDALHTAGVSAREVGYVEGHGSGTRLGDAVELEAFQAVYGSPDRAEPLIVGSAKSNVGHLREAAGVAATARAVGALQRKVLPATVHFRSLNAAVVANDTLQVLGASKPWHTSEPRIVGVSSLGLGGTNAHAIITEAPVPARSKAATRERILVLSGSSPERVAEQAARYARWLEDHAEEDLDSVVRTAQTGRTEASVRRFAVGDSAAELVTQLRAAPKRYTATVRETRARVAFAFPGTGDQYAGMGAALYQNDKTFRSEFDALAKLAVEHGSVDIRPFVLPAAPASSRAMFGAASASTSAAEPRDAALLDARVCQPFLFAFELALATTLARVGIVPDALIGHSLGEITAACVAGVLDPSDAMWLICHRADAVHELPDGAMLAVSMSPTEMDNVVAAIDGAWVATRNAPLHTVVSGTPEAIDDVARHMASVDVSAVRLPTRHAFHTPLLAAAGEQAASAAAARSMVRNIPKIPMLSNVTGDWLTEAQALDVTYFTQQTLASPVQFEKSLGRLTQVVDVIVEIGPGSMTSWIAQLADTDNRPEVLSTIPQRWDKTPHDRTTYRAIAGLWSRGVDVDLSSFLADEARAIPLPPTVRAPESFALPVRPAVMGAAAAASEGGLGAQAIAVPPAARVTNAGDQDSLTKELQQLFQQLLGIDDVDPDDHFFDLGGNSLLGTRVTAFLQRQLGVEVPSAALFADPTPSGMAHTARTLVD